MKNSRVELEKNHKRVENDVRTSILKLIFKDFLVCGYRAKFEDKYFVKLLRHKRYEEIRESVN